MNTSQDQSVRAAAALRGQVYFCALFSGIAGLTYEILWNRDLLLIFGSTTYAASAVLATFMGGMAIGAGLVSRWGAQVRNPLLVYAVVETAVAGYAIFLSSILGVFSEGMASIGSGGTATELMVTPLIVGGAALLLPTVAMGAALPLLGLYLDRLPERKYHYAGILYGFNTLGATVGALTAGFVLLPQFGMNATLVAAILASLAAAGVSLNLAFRAKPRILSQPIKVTGDEEVQRVSLVIWIVVILSGIAALGYQVVWARILVLIFGSSTYSFTIVVAVFVFGIALGSFWSGSRFGRLRAHPEVLAHLQIGVAFVTLVSLFLYGHLPEIFFRLLGLTSELSGILLWQIVIVSVILFPTTFLIGASFPLAIRILDGRELVNRGKNFGAVFGLTSAGNVIGVLISSLILIPLFGLQGTIWSLALISTAAALTLFLSDRNIRFRFQTVGLTVGGLLLIWIWSPNWDPLVMTSGVYAKAPAYRQLAGSDAALDRILSMYRMRFYQEGLNSVVSVVEHPTLGRTPYLALAIDGKVDASTSKDMSTQVLSGHIPFAFNPGAQDVLVIGLASGVTVGSVATHPVRRITVVEIEPAMEAAARIFDSFNHGVLDDPRLELVVDDGRHYVTVTKRQFDLIISEPSNPWMSGPARLFTQEFFVLARKRLRPNGIFAQWLPLYGLGTDHFRSLIRTFDEVFPHVTAFRVSEGDLLLLGSMAPLRIAVDTLRIVLGTPRVKNDLARIEITSSDSLLSYWAGGNQRIKTIGREATLNTDNNGYIEFGAPQYLYQDTLKDNLELVLSSDIESGLIETVLLHKPPTETEVEILITAAEAATERDWLEVAYDIANLLQDANENSAARYVRGTIMARREEYENAVFEWSHVEPNDPLYSTMLLRSAELEIATGSNILDIERIINRLPPGLDIIGTARLKGIIALNRGNPGTALEYFNSQSKNGDISQLSQLPLYQFIAAMRMDNEILVKRYEKRLLAHLKNLRRAAERDESQSMVNEYLTAIAPRRIDWLSEGERDAIERILRTHLLDPLSIYYRAVSLLWMGRKTEAITLFREAAAILPDPDPGSMSNYFLAATTWTDDPQFAKGLLNSFVSARQENKHKADWLPGEANRLLSLMN